MNCVSKMWRARPTIYENFNLARKKFISRKTREVRAYREIKERLSAFFL